MPAPVVIEFIAKGMPDISRAFRSVEAIVVGSERAQLRAVQTTTRSKEREYQKVAREAARWQREAVRSAEKAMRDETRAAEKGAREKARLGERAANEFKRAQDKEVAAAQRAEREKLRAAERTAAAMARIRDRSAAMAGRDAIRSVDRRDRESARYAAESARSQERFGNSIMGAGGRAVSRAASVSYRAASGVAGLVTGLGGGFSIADSVSGQANLGRQAQLLANKAILPGGARASATDIQNKAKAASIATGTDADKLLEAWSAYTDKTGDFQGGEKNLQFFGKLAKATGSDLGQVATTAGLLRVQNKNLDEPAMKQLLLDTVAAGRSGSVDMPELAGHASAITKTSSSYAGSQLENQRKLLGLAQVGVRVGSVSEAATMLSNISGDASKHSTAVSALLGKDTFNAKGQINKGPDEFIADVLAKTGGNREKIQKLGFGQRSLKMFDALLPTYNDAESAALKGGMSKADATAAARKAVMADTGQFTNATMTEASLNKDFAAIMQTSAEQFEAAVRQLKTEVGEKLLPELAKLVPVLQELTPQFVRVLDGIIKIADWASKNPFEGFGALVSAFFIKEMAAAQIGNVVKAAIAGGGGGGGGAGMVPGAGGLAPGAGGATGAAGGVGVGGAMAVTAAAVQQGMFLAERADVVQGGLASGEKRSKELSAMIGKGEGPMAKQEIARAKENSGAADWAMAAVNTAGRASAYMMGPLGMASQWAGDKIGTAITGKGNAADEQVKQTVEAQTISSNAEEIRTAGQKLASALSDAATAASAANSPRDTNMVKRN